MIIKFEYLKQLLFICYVSLGIFAFYFFPQSLKKREFFHRTYALL